MQASWPFLNRLLKTMLFFGLSIVGLGHLAPLWPSLVAAEPSENPTGAFFRQHCVGCHSGDSPKGEFRIDALTTDFANPENRANWQSVHERLAAGTMPPKGKPRPEPSAAKSVLHWLERQLAATDPRTNSSAGSRTDARDRRTPFRRLNQVEYQNTVRDLLLVDVDLKDVLPDDSVSGGFDTDADSLHVSSFLLDGYLAAADRVLDAAIASGPRPARIQRRIELKNDPGTRRHGVYRHLDDGVAIFASDLASNIQLVFWNFYTRTRGKYRFRLSAYAYQSDKPVLFHINGGTDNLGDPPYLIRHFEAPPGKPTTIEFVEQMEAGRNIRLLVDSGVRPRDLPRLGGAESYQGPGLAVQWIEMEGPLGDEWPPPSHRRLLGDLPQAPTADDPARREVVSKDPLTDAATILRPFTRRAFRRAVTDQDIRPFLDRVQARLDAGDSFERSVRVALKAVLVSPEFLFLRSSVPHPEQPDEPARDDFALASRLSYFLWSSLPDDELLTLAEQRQLRRSETLRAQVERLLNDPKAQAFVENFAGQWLGLRNIDATQPDAQLYPEYDDLLRASMLPEAYLFFAEVLRHDLSLTNFVASDFSLLNGRLAAHYGIPGVEGLAFRRVALPPDSHRGGVMTMAAVLKVTANGTTTSPVVRGAWVLDRMLGTPPPKPPAGVEAVEPDIRGATTIREQLAKHRQLEACAGCHVTIDPPGFALESFDVIGGWRDRYRSIGDGEPVTVQGRRMRYKHGPQVDPGDSLIDGRTFRDIDDYKQLLLADKDHLARALAEKLLAYATGAPTGPTARASVESIVAAVRDKNYGFRSLVHELVQGEAFSNP